MPAALAPGNGRDISALATWAEGRYRITPRIFVGARADRLGFSHILGSAGVPATWDAEVRRVEWAAGYYVQRNLVARAAIQSNWRDTSRVSKRTYFCAQLAYWY